MNELPARFNGQITLEPISKRESTKTASLPQSTEKVVREAVTILPVNKAVKLPADSDKSTTISEPVEQTKSNGDVKPDEATNEEKKVVTEIKKEEDTWEPGENSSSNYMVSIPSATCMTCIRTFESELELHRHLTAKHISNPLVVLRRVVVPESINFDIKEETVETKPPGKPARAVACKRIRSYQARPTENVERENHSETASKEKEEHPALKLTLKLTANTNTFQNVTKKSKKKNSAQEKTRKKSTSKYKVVSKSKSVESCSTPPVVEATPVSAEEGTAPLTSAQENESEEQPSFDQLVEEAGLDSVTSISRATPNGVLNNKSPLNIAECETRQASPRAPSPPQIQDETTQDKMPESSDNLPIISPNNDMGSENDSNSGNTAVGDYLSYDSSVNPPLAPTLIENDDETPNTMPLAEEATEIQNPNNHPSNSTPPTADIPEPTQGTINIQPAAFSSEIQHFDMGFFGSTGVQQPLDAENATQGVQWNPNAAAVVAQHSPNQRQLTPPMGGMLPPPPTLQPQPQSQITTAEGEASLLRDFLATDPLAIDKRGTVTVANVAAEPPSEFMSLDRLSQSFTCDVCGERAADRAGLEDHRARRGHYMCPQCPNKTMVCRTIEEFNNHLAAHAQANYYQQPQPNIQQLQQQVHRIGAARRASPIYRPPYNYPNPNQPYQSGPPPPPQPPPAYPVQQQPGRFVVPQEPRNRQRMIPPQQPGALPTLRRIPQAQAPMVPQQSPPQQAPPPMGRKRGRSAIVPDEEVQMIAMQKRNDSGQTNTNSGATLSNSSRVVHNPETIRLNNSISLSVRQPNSPQAQQQGKKADAKVVASLLSSRGITVTPAAQNASPGNNTGQTPAKRMRAQQSTSPATNSGAVPTLNLNSAISILPAGATRSNSNSNGGNFATPPSRNVQNQQMERPPRPPTVDLTEDHPSPHHRLGQPARRGRPPAPLPNQTTGGRFTCHICDKPFASQEVLNQHIAQHRNMNKLPFKCTLCSAQYPTQQGLMQHRLSYHKEGSTPPQTAASAAQIQVGTEMALPVVDLKLPGVVARLSQLGVQHYIPLSQLMSQGGGFFSLPIVNVDGARNPNVTNLSSIGATSVLSLGPIKMLPR